MAIKIPIQISQVVSGNLQPVSTYTISDIVAVSAGTTNVVSYSDFQNLGNGNYTLGSFSIPSSSTAQGCEIQLKVSGTLKPALGTFTVYNDLDEPWTATKTIELAAGRVDRAGDNLVGPYFLSYWAFNPMGLSGDVIAMTGSNMSTIGASAVPSKGYVDNRISSSTASLTGFASNSSLSGYASLTANQGFSGLNTFNNAVVFNTSTVSLVATNFNANGATGNFKRHNVEVISNTASAGVFGSGVDMMSASFKDTGGDTSSIISWGFDAGETPYINFHNTPLQNINLGTTIAIPIGSHERVVDPLWGSSVEGYTYNSLPSAIANVSGLGASAGNEYWISLKDIGRAWDTSMTTHTDTAGVNLVGDGNTRFVCAANSFGASNTWKDFRIQNGATIQWKDKKLIGMTIILLNVHTSNPDLQLNHVEAYDCTFVSASAITTFGGSNKFFNCKFNTPVSGTTAGDIYVNCIQDSNFSNITL